LLLNLQMKPLKLVLVRGPIQSTIALKTLAQKLLPTVKILKPSVGHVLDLTSGSHILQVSDKLNAQSSLYVVYYRAIGQ